MKIYFFISDPRDILLRISCEDMLRNYDIINHNKIFNSKINKYLSIFVNQNIISVYVRTQRKIKKKRDYNFISSEMIKIENKNYLLNFYFEKS
jgi:hypothetical protein